LTLVGAGVVADLDAEVVTAGAAVGALLGGVGVGQLGVWLRRALTEPGSGDGTPPA
jgi:CDP-diacylglycerol--glycerol-3-phosphate 3-phosphatidyltransferase